MIRWTIGHTCLAIAFAMIAAAVVISYATDTPPVHRPRSFTQGEG
jgi:hypothetical protein